MYANQMFPRQYFMKNKEKLNSFEADTEVILDSFRRNKDSKLKTLLGLYKGNYFRLFMAVVLFAVKHCPVWVLPIATANIINIATEPDENALRNIIINVAVMVVLVAQNVLSNYFHVSFYSKAIRSVEAGLRSTMVTKLQKLSMTFHNEIQSGRLQSKIIRDVEQIEGLSSQIFISVLSIIMNIIVAFAVVVSSSMTVFLFFLGTIPVAVLIRTVFRRSINTRNRELRKEMEETSVSVVEMVELIPVTRAHALEEVETKKLSNQLKKTAEKGFRLDVIQSLFGSISWASFQIFQVICLGFTGYLAAKGTILPGDVVMYQTYFSTIVNQVSGIITLLPIISKGMEAITSVGEVLLSEDLEEPEEKPDIGEVKGNIEFRNVTFQFHDADTPVLKDLSFSVKAGETIAFVGASGAGKTTILNLVIGFLRAQSGQILIDGKNIDEYSRKSYREYIAVVPQNAIIFTGTIRDNIVYGKENVDEAFLNEVVRSANLEELISSLPDGLDTKINEHGANLSGGQRQRVSIARAFIRNPKILILDEATSALDTVSERKIQESVDRLVQDRTTLIVAHRLSTIRNADRIAVIGDGGLLEFGTFDELMDKKGEFYHMRTLQG